MNPITPTPITETPVSKSPGLGTGFTIVTSKAVIVSLPEGVTNIAYQPGTGIDMCWSSEVLLE